MNSLKKKLIIVFVVIFLVLALLAGWSYLSQRIPASTFSIADVSALDEIILTSPGAADTTMLKKTQADAWIQAGTNTPVNESALEEMMEVLSRIAVRWPVSSAESDSITADLRRYGIGVEIRGRAYFFSIGDLQLFPYQRRLYKIYVGNDLPDFQGTYMIKDGSNMPQVIHRPGFEIGLADVFDYRPEVWKNPVVFDISADELSSVKVIIPGNTMESYTLRVDFVGQSFSFYSDEGQPILQSFVPDTTKVVRFISSFEDLYYEKLLTKEEEQQRLQLMFNEPFMTVMAVDNQGDTTTVSFFARKTPEDILQPAQGVERDPNRFYLLVDDNFALAQYFVFGRILRPLSYFAAE